MDGLLPITEASKELISTSVVGALLVLSIWWIGRKEAREKDLHEFYNVKLAEKDRVVQEKDKLIQQLQESRIGETRQLVEAVGEINAALLANKTGIDSLMPLLQSLARGR